MTERPALGVGLMSGTSLDGMDAALVRLAGPTSAELLAFTTTGYGAADRVLLERATAEEGARGLAHLHSRLGRIAVTATQAVLDRAGVSGARLDFISFHGHTLWHEPPVVTWQVGDPAALAEAFGVRVVHDFRSRDVAAGGEGAPLAPMADVLLYGHPRRGRVLLNIGGMANLTWVPRLAAEHGVLAFDTGPGMALIDSLARLVEPDLPFDVDAAVSTRGTARPEAVERILADPFFRDAPPKSTGRERFGATLARQLAVDLPGPDGVATAVAVTVESIARAIRTWVPADGPEVVVSGGGRRHPGVWRGLEELLGRSSLRPFDELFYDGDAKEAVAFALLGYLTLHGQPGNVPAATGAAGGRVLGSITAP